MKGSPLSKNTNRPQIEKPYSDIVWLARPLKTVLIVSGMLSGILWVIGIFIQGSLPQTAIYAAGGACVGLLGTYCIIATISTHRRERFAEACAKKRRAKLADFAGAGFIATRKFIGSSRIFAVDENHRKWFLIDYFNHIEDATLHDLSSIAVAEKALNRDWVPRDNRILLSTGGMLYPRDNNEYFSRTGVLLTLDENGERHVFINCFKTENDADLILDYLASLGVGRGTDK